jgi:hypothetical protein
MGNRANCNGTTRVGSGQDCSVGTARNSAVGSPSPSLLAKRDRFHLAYRLASRSYQLLVARSSQTPQRRMSAAAICAIGDIVGAVALRRTDRFALAPRLAVDAVDGALWAQGSTGLELATMTGVPLAIEAGLRLGVLGLIVPAVNASVTGLIRRLRRRTPSTGSFRYQVMTVALGAGIASYEANRRRVAAARHQQGLEARVGAAHLAGQNEIATGADTVVDLLSRTTPMLNSSLASASVGRMLADWRQSLAVSTSEQATYLGVALARWRRRHNDSQPNLAVDVTFDLPEGHGTILLSSRQEAWFEAALDTLALRGTLKVKVVDIAEARQPNQPRRLIVGEHTLKIPADLNPGLVPFDVGPLGFLASTMWFADTLLPGGCDPSPWAVAPGAAVGSLLAIWAHREVVRRGESAHAKVLLVALAHGLVHAAASTGTMRSTKNPEGIQRFPFLGGINMVALMLPLYWNDLDNGERVMVVSAVISILVLGLFLFPERIAWNHFIAELLWPAAAFYSMSTMRTQLASDALQLSAELEMEDQRSVANALAEGRSYVLGLASETRYAARRDFAAFQGQMDPRVRAEVGRRLDEVDKRLEELTCANEW